MDWQGLKEWIESPGRGMDELRDCADALGVQPGRSKAVTQNRLGLYIDGQPQGERATFQPGSQRQRRQRQRPRRSQRVEPRIHFWERPWWKGLWEVVSSIALVLTIVLAAGVIAALIATWCWNQARPSTSQEVESAASQGLASIPDPGCFQARGLGPWAPDGQGENFEVTCNETNCSGVHVQLWWPGGSGQDWGENEISVYIPPGLSIRVKSGGGRGWEYPSECFFRQIEDEILADNARRITDTNFYGRVDIDELLTTELVEVRFDRR